MKHFNIFFFIFIGLSLSSHVYAQGTAYTFKGGFSGSFEKWLGFNDNPLISPHAAIEIESFTEDDQSSLYALLGYYTHGTSTNINSFINQAGERVDVSGKFKINNLGISIGAKGKKDMNEKAKAYYSIGVRGEYSINNNFDIYQDNGSFGGFALNPFFLRKINYGVSVGGGIQYQLSDKYDGILDISINPDISKQYDQPPLGNVLDPRTGQTINIRARSVRNLLVAITIGIRMVKY